jgi:hypothetical protein
LFGVRGLAKRAGASCDGFLVTDAGKTESFANSVEEFVHGVVLGVDAHAVVRLALVSLQTVAI